MVDTNDSMIKQKLDDVHYLFIAGNPDLPTVVLLHGTGGDENDLVPIAKYLAPNHPILAIRGRVLENGYHRFFERYADAASLPVRHRADVIDPFDGRQHTFDFRRHLGFDHPGRRPVPSEVDVQAILLRGRRILDIEQRHDPGADHDHHDHDQNDGIGRYPRKNISTGIRHRFFLLL